jgi:hypothetical protein
VQLLLEEYLFKIMLDFLHYFCSNDHSMESYCTFLQKHHPLSKGLLYTYMKRFPLVQELKQCHTLSQGLQCVLKVTFSNERHTLLKAILCIHVKTIDIFQKKTCSELCYLKIMVLFSIWMLFLLSKEDCLTPLFKPIYFMIFHEIMKYFVKWMPHSWKTNVYIHFLS